MKNKIREQTRNRVRMLRGVASIMKQDSMSLFSTVDLRKTMFRKEKSLNEKEIKQPPSLRCNLRHWAIEYNVKRRAVSALLKILISFGISTLPRDSRTLLKTPRVVHVENRAGGQYWHNGLQSCLTKIFGKLSSNINIQLNFNIDGLPLFKSSPISFWPILFNIHDMPDIRPMVVGIWCGERQPNNLNEFLEPFVNEICALTKYGLKVNGYKITISIRCFICDSPARSFLKGFHFSHNIYFHILY